MAVTNYYSAGGELLGEKAAGGQRLDYLTDALGSVTATVDQTGSVVNRYRYKPYGGLLSKSGVSADPAFQYVGGPGYRQTGKKYSDVYVRARHYDTANGRWATKDPIGFSGGDWNLFRYCSVRPVVLRDPSGLECPKPKICGANIDKWIAGEVNRQLAIAKQFKARIIDTGDTSKLPAGYNWCGSKETMNYLGWANMNQGYKNMPPLWHATDCLVDCGNTVTLCGVCLSGDQLGNIMFGLVGRALGFSLVGLTAAIDCLKQRTGRPICDEKHQAYDLGWLIAAGGLPGSVTQQWFCEAFTTLLTTLPKAVDDCAPVVSYKGCKPCNNPPKGTNSGIYLGNELSECWHGNGGPICPPSD